MSQAAQIEYLRRRLAASTSLDELEHKLLSIAPRFHDAVRRRTMVGRRDDLGLRVVSLDMPYQGLAALSGSETFVALSQNAGPVRRRQTLAHECGHGLLRDVDRQALGLSREREDVICSRFARRVLMPPNQVKRHLRRYGFPADVGALHSFCGEFRVSVRAAIAALNEYGRQAGSAVLIAATYRPHEKRPREFDFRVDVCASDPELFVPRDRRLITMGLRDLSWWAVDAHPGSQRAGREDHVIFRARSEGARCWHGPAPWQARVYKAGAGHQLEGARSLVISLDRSEMKKMWGDPTRRARSFRPVPRIDGQIGLPAAGLTRAG